MSDKNIKNGRKSSVSFDFSNLAAFNVALATARSNVNSFSNKMAEFEKNNRELTDRNTKLTQENERLKKKTVENENVFKKEIERLINEHTCEKNKLKEEIKRLNEENEESQQSYNQLLDSFTRLASIFATYYDVATASDPTLVSKELKDAIDSVNEQNEEEKNNQNEEKKNNISDPEKKTA